LIQIKKKEKSKKQNKDKGKQLILWNIMLFNSTDEEKEAFKFFHSKYIKHMVVYLKKRSYIVEFYFKGYFILNRSQRINWLKKNLNSLKKYLILNDYHNEIRKFLINNLTVFIDDGDL
jgi:ribosomal protein S8